MYQVLILMYFCVDCISLKASRLWSDESPALALSLNDESAGRNLKKNSIGLDGK